MNGISTKSFERSKTLAIQLKTIKEITMVVLLRLQVKPLEEKIRKNNTHGTEDAKEESTKRPSKLHNCDKVA